MARYFAVMPSNQARRTRIGTFPDLEGIPNMISGELITRVVPSPLRFELDPSLQGDRQHFYSARFPFITTTLLDALRGAGVSDLQAFPATLVNPVDGTTWDDYHAVNFAPAVEAVDFAESDHTNEHRLIRAEFDGFAIDPSKPAERRLFRLAEALGILVAREDLAAEIQTAIPGALRFIDTADFAT